MKLLLALIFITSAHAQIIRDPKPRIQVPPRGGSQRPSGYTPPPRVGTSPSNWNVPKPNLKLMFGASTTPTGIILDEEWKVKLNQYALKNVVHPSWGYSHSERNYHNTKLIASASGIEVDEDVLLASSFLHDLGGLPGFEKEGVDHGLRSAQLSVPLLRSWGFPEEKLSLVEEVMINHVYYGVASQSEISKAFRDADMLDFLGPMGVARLVAAVMDMGNPVSIGNSIEAVEQMQKKLPGQFSYKFSKMEGEKRIRESKEFLKKLEEYSFKRKAY